MNTKTKNATGNAREVALAVVRDVFGPERRAAQASFSLRATRAELDARDRAFATELAYGSIKARRLLDWQLAPYVGERLATLPPTIMEILRLGMYQLHHLAGVEAHAAVSETVNQAWRHGHRGTAGLVNAVLRRSQADGVPVPERASFDDEKTYLGTRYSLPSWMAERMATVLGDRTEAALAGINEAPRHAVRVNALRATVAEAREILSGFGVETERSPFVDESLLATEGTATDDREGRWSVQSEAASMPVDLLDPRAGERILDLCSGRGNKSVQIAARTRDAAEHVCVELEPKKANALRESLRRGGAANVAVVEGDAREAAAEFRADAILIDAPCSGLGIIGRHPEARWRKDPADGARLGELQAALVRAAASRTAENGRIVYAVCSVDAREGRDVVDGFLAERADFARAQLPERYAPFASDGDVLVPPGIDGRDGFYVAVLRRG